MGIKKKTSKSNSSETPATAPTKAPSVKKSVKKASTSRSVASTSEDEDVEKSVKRVKKSVVKRMGRPEKTLAESFAFEIEPRASRLSAKERNQRWEQLKSLLRNKDVAELVDIIGQLYRISDDAAEYVRSLFARDESEGESLLEEFREGIVKPFGLGRKDWTDPPRIGGLKKKIRDYLKGTGDVRGAVDLTLTLLETATAYTMRWGDINAQFYDPLNLSARDVVKLITESRECSALFQEFKERLLKLGDAADDLGWGYGDSIREMVEDIFYANDVGLKRVYVNKHYDSQWVIYELGDDDSE